MNIHLSGDAAAALLETLSTMLDGGWIELRTGLADEHVELARLKLSEPAAEIFGDHEPELVFRKIIEEDAALAQGEAKAAFVHASDGTALFWCDVGDVNSDAVIKLNTTKIFRGGPVRLTSFRLRF